MSAFGETPSERPPEDGRRPPGRRGWSSQRLRWTLAAIVLLVVLIAVAPHHSGHSRTLPTGAWGRTLVCLERDQTYLVRDPATGALPDASTRTVVVQRFHGTEIAELRVASSDADARTIARTGLNAIDPVDAQASGTIAWAYALNGDPPHDEANPGDRIFIGFCVRTPDRR